MTYTPLLWLDEKDVDKALEIKDCIQAIESAFCEHARGAVQMPGKVYLDFKEFNGDLRAMPGYLASAGLAGVKIVNSHADNIERGLPTVQAILVLNEPSTGRPLAIVSATRLTELRTGAAGGVAAKYMAGRNSKIVGLVGCGRQAKTQLSALASLFDIEEIRVWGRTTAEAGRFAEDISEIIQATRWVICETLESCCHADIVVTTTPSRAPLIKSEWISPGTHINAIGADAPGKQELEPALLKRSQVVVDDISQSSHAGEINVPLARGEFKPEDVYATLGEIITGKKIVRERGDEITIFDSTGLAIQDIAVGALLLKKAKELNLGQPLV